MHELEDPIWFNISELTSSSKTFQVDKIFPIMLLSFSDIMKKYKIVDLSHTFEDWMPRPQVPYGHIPWKSYEKGDSFNTFMFLVFEHAGTHVDAPKHLGGVDGPSIDEVPIESWIGDCWVLDMSHKKEKEEVYVDEVKEWENINGPILEGGIVLFNFDWEKKWSTSYGVENQPYMSGNPGLSEETAIYLVEKGVKLVGGDIPTIDSDANPEEPAHRVLLPKHILVLENVKNLDKLPPKESFVMAIPLKIKEGTGSPVRAIAFVPR